MRQRTVHRSGSASAFGSRRGRYRVGTVASRHPGDRSRGGDRDGERVLPEYTLRRAERQILISVLTWVHF